MKTNKYNTLHYLLAMLKAYDIKDIIASPGAQNARFNSLAQYDEFLPDVWVFLIKKNPSLAKVNARLTD